jgi:trimeric autotransporter adhesin
MKHRLVISALSILLSAAVAAEIQGTPDEETDHPEPAHIQIRHLEPKGIGYDQGYTTIAGFFSPFWSRPVDRWLPFLDLRGHLFNNNRFAANAGLGLRYLADDRVWGINAFYDYRNTSHQHYNQVSAGLESLGQLFDFRINGYLPVGAKLSPFSHVRFDKFDGHSLLLRGKREFVLKGANAEVGIHVDGLRNAPFYFAAGPYYLTGQGRTAWGGQLRASVDLFPNAFRFAGRVSSNQVFFRLEGNTSYDPVFKWIGQGQISLNVGLGGRKPKQGQSTDSVWHTVTKRGLQGVDRFEIIPVSKKHFRTEAINPETGDPYVFWFVNNQSSSAGTIESPFPSLANAQAASAPHDVIYVFPGNGTTSQMNAGIVLQANQRFWGSGNEHRIPTQLGSIKIPAQTTTSPRMTNLAGVGITLASSNEVSGFLVASPSSYGIYGQNVLGSLITEMAITTPGNTGIYLDEHGTIATTFNLGRLSITNPAMGDVINLTASDNTQISINVFDSVLIGSSNAGTSGISLNMVGLAAITSNITNNSITSRNLGILLNASLATAPYAIVHQNIANNEISLSSNAGIRVTGNFQTLNQTIANNHISSNTGANIELTSLIATTINQNILNNTLLSSNLAGISVNTATATTLNQNILYNTIRLNAQAGIQLASSTLTTLTQSILGNNLSSNLQGVTLSITATTFNQNLSNNSITSNVFEGHVMDFSTLGTFNQTVQSNAILNNGTSTNRSGLSIGNTSISTLNQTIINNTISGNGNSGIFANAVTVQTLNSTMTHNIISNNGAYGINVGISNLSSSPFQTIGENIMFGNVSGPVSISEN